METLALIVGLAAVFFFLLSYQFPKRKAIIACNVTSRVLYILQYLLLLAFEGAAMDLSAIPSSLFAARKHTPFVEKHRFAIILGVNAFVIGIGLLVWRNWLSWVPVVGVLLETNALWMTKEKHIRWLSLAALPWAMSWSSAPSSWPSAATIQRKRKPTEKNCPLQSGQFYIWSFRDKL